MVEKYKRPDKYKFLVSEMNRFFNQKNSKKRELEEYFKGIERVKIFFKQTVKLLSCSSFKVSSKMKF